MHTNQGVTCSLHVRQATLHYFFFYANTHHLAISVLVHDVTAAFGWQHSMDHVVIDDFPFFFPARESCLPSTSPLQSNPGRGLAATTRDEKHAYLYRQGKPSAQTEQRLGTCVVASRELAFAAQHGAKARSSHHVVVGAHGEDAGGGDVWSGVQGSGRRTRFEHLADAALCQDLVLSRLHVQACFFFVFFLRLIVSFAWKRFRMVFGPNAAGEQRSAADRSSCVSAHGVAVGSDGLSVRLNIVGPPRGHRCRTDFTETRARTGRRKQETQDNTRANNRRQGGSQTHPEMAALPLSLSLLHTILTRVLEGYDFSSDEMRGGVGAFQPVHIE